MLEILEEINILQNKERGCVPNLQGASPVSSDVGRSFVRRTEDQQREA